MILSDYLKRAGLISGSLVSGNTSVSGSGANLRTLLGLPPVVYGKVQNYGVAAHEQFLENKKTTRITPEEQKMVDAAIKNLWANTLVRKLMNNSTKEEKLYKKIFGVLVAFILDIHDKKNKIGADLKTTSCTTLKQFVESAKSYGYFRQAYVYKIAARLKLFFFIGITKTKTPEVFIFCAEDFKDEMKYAEQEVVWLFYIFKHYGKLNNFNK